MRDSLHLVNFIIYANIIIGYNGEGRLGLGDFHDRKIPTELKLDIEGQRIIGVYAGAYHTFLLTN
jgi:hypothetical protein